jgi:hypothetical protein
MEMWWGKKASDETFELSSRWPVDAKVAKKTASEEIASRDVSSRGATSKHIVSLARRRVMPHLGMPHLGLLHLAVSRNRMSAGPAVRQKPRMPRWVGRARWVARRPRTRWAVCLTRAAEVVQQLTSTLLRTAAVARLEVIRAVAVRTAITEQREPGEEPGFS